MKFQSHLQYHEPSFSRSNFLEFMFSLYIQLGHWNTVLPNILAFLFRRTGVVKRSHFTPFLAGVHQVSLNYINTSSGATVDICFLFYSMYLRNTNSSSINSCMQTLYMVGTTYSINSGDVLRIVRSLI